ncbi:MAG TPA: ribonuclease R [Haliea salexigens]|uniref:Ribonuclease R n=1 Tax=Haliea salexigens TaxID=287487 RepID=A0A3C1KKJ3_9GAMM|nr:ribonuclease R [Haliea sp.]HAN26983.1 ribonuclease R [Haliea salexigens]|tara:strand:+ start:134 stop:2542 length:2409 start_codon:yes stop_codon:yes gene_type:complete
MAKKGKIADPHAEREAARYDNPIPSREVILDLLTAADKPLSHPHIARDLDLHEEEQVEALRKRLRAMERDGQLMVNRRGAYGLVDKLNLLRCRVQGHRDGYGFAIPLEEGDDVYLSSRQMQFVFDGDEVLVGIIGLDRRGRPEGRVVEVLHRGTSRIVGRYEEESGIGFVVPDNSRVNHRVLIPPKLKGGAKSGQIVTAEITDYPTRNLGAKGQIVEVLGDHLDPGLEIDVAIRSHGIPHEWPEAVLREAGSLEEEPREEDKKYRADLRGLGFVTIDGEDARDFDDAVYCEKRLRGWRLWVAIADVSHYVRPGSALDEEAALRGNSVYFPEQVVPMLPEALSNGLCSLKPKVDRLAMVCEMELSGSGKLTGFRFYEAVIHSQARLTYTQVGEVLEGGSDPQIDKNRLKDLKRLQSLYKVLRKARDVRGAIDFETTETRILFNEQRKIDAIVPVVRNDAHKLIEECMLCANVAAARFYEEHELPVLYRVHEGPTPEKLENLRAFLGELGLDLRGGEKPTPAHYGDLLDAVQERDDANVIQTMLLRSLRQAVYTPENEGHFGLHYPAYAHFTSPIRRYADLLVHRGIRHIIRSKGRTKTVQRQRGAPEIPREAIFPYTERDMVAQGLHCSMTERRADDATRDVESWLKCEFLQEHVGDEFDGVIAAVTSFGLFVELQPIYIEGLVHISALPGDYYSFDASKQRLVGERSGRSYRLGGRVRVQVARVDLDDKKIDLELIDAPSANKAKSSKPRKRKAEGSASANPPRKKAGAAKPKAAAKSGAGSRKSGEGDSAKPAGKSRRRRR